MITAPWTDDQVEALNRWQKAGVVHPFTCPGDQPGCGDHRELIARADGWHCSCGAYRQDWAHDFMLKDPTAFGGGWLGRGEFLSPR